MNNTIERKSFLKVCPAILQKPLFLLLKRFTIVSIFICIL